MTRSDHLRRVSQCLALVTLAAVHLTGCTTVERVRTAVNAVTPIRSAPEPVRSPITYVCDANEATRTWECQTTRTSDGTVIDTSDDADAAPDPQPARSAEPARRAARTEPASAAAPAAPSAPIGTSDSDILSSPGDAFAVQLIALNDERALLAYATEHGIDRPIYTQTRAGDDAQFVLLLGIYPDRSAADAALSGFVAGRTLAVTPWVRPLAPLQQTVRSLLAD